MENTVRIDLLEVRRKDQIQNRIFYAPGIDSLDVCWNRNNNIRRFSTQDPPLPIAETIESKDGMIFTRGIPEILTSETEIQVTQKTYTRPLKYGDCLKSNRNSSFALMIGSSKDLIKMALSVNWSCKISQYICDTYEIA